MRALINAVSVPPEALRFYRKAGFTHCQDFGPYTTNDYAASMAKTIIKDTS